MTAPTKPTTAQESGKVAAVKEFGAEHGWKHGSIKPNHKQDAVTLKLRRTKEEGGEFIEVRWDGNAIKELIVVSDGTTLKYVRNVAALKRHLAAPEKERLAVFVEKPKPERKPKAEKSADTTERRIARAKSSRRRKAMPFSSDSPDEQILDAVRGRKITWLTRLAHTEEEDRIEPARNTDKGKFYISHGETENRRQLQFVGSCGFRAVYIDAITAVR